MMPNTLAPTPSGTARNRADALEHDGAAHEARISLGIRSQNRLSVGHDFVDNRTADANLANLARAIPQARDGNFQLRVLGVAHHDHAAIGRDGFEYQRDDLLERFIERD
jgi:hypothetical protein